MIVYSFEIENGPKLRFEVELNRPYSESPEGIEPAFWTELAYHQCDVCPWRSATERRCPPALELQEVIRCFSPIASYQQAYVRVTTPEREYSRRCEVQVGLNSLLGVVMATSRCPILSRLRPMADFHLPFASVEETVFRTVGAYLVQQYLLMREGRTPDFQLDGLEALYQQLVRVNTSFIQRIRAASSEDANLNAVIRLDSFSLLVLFSLQEGLVGEKMRFLSGKPKGVEAGQEG